MTSPLPPHPNRILLVNPTRYLGNLLIAGGLIQHFAAHCAARDIEFAVVLDEAFAPLIGSALPGVSVLWYPRRAIRQAGWWQKLRLYLGFLRKLRRLNAALAFNIEEDSTSDRLTRWSGAPYRLGCSTARHRRGYSQVLPVNFANRPEAQRHRWYSFMEVFAALGLPEQAPGYLRLNLPPLSPEQYATLKNSGLDSTRPLALIHAGATKDYKKWPQAHFAELTRLLVMQGMQVGFIGAGQDAVETRQILDLVRDLPEVPQLLDLTNRLSLPELGSLMRKASVMIGNDSGPFHLATALKIPGVVIFGPTEAALWRPLGPHVTLLQKRNLCSPQCSRKHCIHAHRCLTAIAPQQVVDAVNATLKTPA